MGDLQTYPERTRDPVRVGDALRVVAASLWWLLSAALRRLLGRRRRPGWSFGYEVTVAAYRGSWSVMPKIGVVRWRNVGEALSPLQTGGLTPRFVRYGQGVSPFGALWLEPPGAGDAVLLYFHGGGFAFASLRTHGNLVAALARASQARTLAIEYRLSPEHPAPAAIEDALAAYRQLVAEGISPKRIVLVGDSAGGTLVLNVLLALRDAGEALPAAGVAICPWVDLGCSGESFVRNAELDFVGEAHCRLVASAYLAGADASRPDLSPLFARLSGLPPLLVQAGECETLVDQVCELARRAQSDGAEVELSVYPDMVHVWHMLGNVTPAAQRAIDEVGAFVREHTKG
jgi:acetyl esterase/lipase